MVSYRILSKVLPISGVHLKHLEIKKCSNSYNASKNKLKIVVSATNLIHFFWKSGKSACFILENLLALDITEIDILLYDSEFCRETIIENGYADCMMNCLKGLHNVKSLTLSPHVLQGVSKLPWELENWRTPFSNLRHLHLETWTRRDCFQVVMCLLKNSLRVETLVLNMKGTNINSDEHGSESSLDLKLHHLKLIEVWNVSGYVNGLEYLKILLKNAVALKKMTIFTRMEFIEPYKTQLNNFIEETLAVPRASSDSTISIYRPS